MFSSHIPTGIFRILHAYTAPASSASGTRQHPFSTPTRPATLWALCLGLTLLLSACGSAGSETTGSETDAAQATPPTELSSAQHAAGQNDSAAGSDAQSESVADGDQDASAGEAANGAAATTPVPPNGSTTGPTVGPPDEYAGGAAAELDPRARNGMYTDPPPLSINPERHYYATLKTEQGDIRVQLFADRAPLTVNNFVFLAKEGFYNDTSFHRVIDGFMAQAGDPTGSGAGGPGYTFEDEFYPGLRFDQAGLLAMANSGPNTNGSQFFLTYGPTDWLDYRHTIFGKVIEGEDVLARISLRDPNTQPDFPGDTLYTVLIEESESSVLPTPTPLPPTPTPTPTPTPYAPTELNLDDRPLATVSLPSRVNYFNQPPDLVIDPNTAYTATIVTSRGELVVELATASHPQAVNNFIVLARLGFYDNTPITLVRPDDSVIFGLPDNNPLNDAGYKFPAEMNVGADPEFGSLAYIPFETRADGTTLSSSSQILIALVQPLPQFKEQLSFFGKVVDGQSVLNRLTMADTILGIRIADAGGDLDPDLVFSTPAADEDPSSEASDDAAPDTGETNDDETSDEEDRTD